MINIDKNTEIFYIVDEFLKIFYQYVEKHHISYKKSKRRNRKYRMSDSEIITILILYHLSGYKNFKVFYTNGVQIGLKNDFPKTVSYNRFLELREKVFIPMACLLKNKLLSKCTGISFIDSTPLKVCDLHRIGLHKTLKLYANKGKCSMGWFYGFKLHIICNERGEIVNFQVTKGNVDDRQVLKDKEIIKNIKGKLLGDRGYVSRELTQELYKSGIQLITKLKSNMKNILMDRKDKLLLKHRGLIESLNNKLKNSCEIEHSRHRSLNGFLVNIISALSAYQLMPNKPHIRYFNKHNPLIPNDISEILPLLIPS